MFVPKPRALSAVDRLRFQGLSPAKAYDAANSQAAQRTSAGGTFTRDNASNTGKGSGPGGSLARGDRSYDASSNTWR